MGTKQKKQIGMGIALTVMMIALTAVSVMADVNINETFDASTAPAGWTVRNNSGTAAWKFDNPNNYTGGAGNVASVETSATSSDSELRTPVMNFSGISSVTLSFKTFFYIFSATPSVEADISADGGSTWTNFWAQTTAVNPAATVSKDLSALAANKSNVMIRFHIKNPSALWEIDDVKISGLSMPDKPLGLGATLSSSGSQVILTWQDTSSNEAGFKIERSLNSSTGFAEIGKVAANVQTYTDTSSSCQNTYYYRVAAYAGAMTSYSDIASATTANCPVIASLNETFSTAALPTDWTNPTNGWVFNDPNNRKTSLGLSTESKFALADGFRGSLLTAELRTPLLNLKDRPIVKLVFRTYFYYSSGSADVDVSTDKGITWNNVWRLTANYNYTTTLPDGTKGFKEQSVDLTAQAGGKPEVIIRFRANAMSAVWMIDDVRLESIAKPLAPSELTAALGQNSVVSLTWKNGDSFKSDFDIERSLTGSTDWKKIDAVTAGATQYTDSGVAGNTPYYYRVRAVNSAGTSDYSAPVNITTGDRSSIVYDMVVSYYDTPANTVAKKAAIENIIRNFADGVYEQSNGADKLGKVTIYTNGNMADKANMVWIKQCWNKANLSGYGKPGLFITMCDIFENGGNPFDYFISENNQIKGGYTNAHEWGHFFYALYDEYVNSSTPCGGSPSSPCATDTPVQNSMMNSQWKVFKADGTADYNWLNFSTSLNNTGNTAQYRVYGASAWETLVRPVSEDPRTGTLSNMPARVYYPELQAVAPAQGKSPSIELTGLTGGAARDAARSALNIIWADLPSGTRENNPNGKATLILIDNSSGLSQYQLDGMKKSVKELTDQIAIGDMLGIMTFSSSTVSVYPVTTVSDEPTKTAIKAAVDTITLSTQTANIGKALDAALAEITAKAPDGMKRTVFLITPGNNASNAANPIVSAWKYEGKGVKINAFGYGAEEKDATTLKSVADITKGTYSPVNKPAELQKSIMDAEEEDSPVVDVNIKVGLDLVTTSTHQVPFYIDSTLRQFGIYVDYYKETATVSLIDPDGVPHAIPADSYTSYNDEWSLLNVCVYNVDNPKIGTWQLVITRQASTEFLNVFYWIDGQSKPGILTYEAHTESLSGENITDSSPILITAFAAGEFSITGASVKGLLTSSDGFVQEFDLADDGVAPDAIAGDGNYAKLFNPTRNGEYYVTVLFSNPDGTAKFTNKGVNFAPAIDGSIPADKTWAVGENFERFAEFKVNITGVKPDDHSDLYTDNPSVLKTDNVSMSGQINHVYDIDTFKITVPDDFSDNKIVLRVDSLGFGMVPWLYIYGQNADGAWEIDRFLENAGPDDYLSVPINVKPGETFYAEVMHYDVNAAQGSYKISAGSVLESETISLLVPVYSSSPAPGVIPAMSSYAPANSTTTLTVTNTGSDTLIIASATLGGTNKDKFSISPNIFPVNVAKGKYQVFTITGIGSTAGTFNGTLEIAHNALGSPAKYTLTEIVSAYTEPVYYEPSYYAPPSNQAPVADKVYVSTEAGKPIPIKLTGSDPDSNFFTLLLKPMTYSLAIQPQHGTLSGTAPNLTYTPAAGYIGTDSFTFKISDGTSDSAPAPVTVVIHPVGNVYVGDNYAMDIFCAEYQGVRYAFKLDHLKVSGDPSGFYWKMDTSTFRNADSSLTNCIPVGNDLKISIPSAVYQGKTYQFSLNYNPISDDSFSLYWKMDLDTLKSR